LIISLPLFFILVYIDRTLLTRVIEDFLIINDTQEVIGGILIRIVGIFLILAFLVKMPIFILHLWLPKAHVEAPVAGSIILAGVLLKLGGYGLCRVFMKFNFLKNGLSGVLVRISLVGITLIGLVCCRINDIKSLVAYSSVAHIGLVICGLSVNRVWGTCGAVLLILRHGLRSSGLFCFVNLVYESTRRRSLFINKGLITLLPIYSLFIFILCSSNFSAPPGVGILSEIILIVRLIRHETYLILIFPIGSFLGVVFSLYLFMNRQHGKNFKVHRVVFNLFLDYHLIIIHLLPINLLVIKGGLLLFR
jgi:NADH-ubiquinone oxidoreductase chain 4